MASKNLYDQVVALLPYSENVGARFKIRLKTAHDKYLDLLKKESIASSVIAEVKDISERLQRIVSNYEKGVQSTAYVQLQNLIQGKKGLLPKIDLAKALKSFDSGKPHSFYRIRLMDSIYHIKANEMFHIPLSRRGIVKTQRYSTPGYPCLYLGESIYGCWEEMRRPSMQLCAVSRFECDRPLNIIDLSRPEDPSQLNQAEYLKLIPLMISCMIPVSDHDATYKPEYIIPQLLMQWILKNRMTKNIDGICYTSTHINGEFSFPTSKFLNYAIPVYNINSNKKFCKKLCEYFKVTDPTTNDIEKLKGGYGMSWRTAGLSLEEIKEENYSNSDFGNLEQRLSNTKTFPLRQIDPRG